MASRIKEDTLSRRRERDRLRRETETPEERGARFKSRRNKPYMFIEISDHMSYYIDWPDVENTTDINVNNSRGKGVRVMR